MCREQAALAVGVHALAHAGPSHLRVALETKEAGDRMHPLLKIRYLHTLGLIVIVPARSRVVGEARSARAQSRLRGHRALPLAGRRPGLQGAPVAAEEQGVLSPLLCAVPWRRPCGTPPSLPNV